MIYKPLFILWLSIIYSAISNNCAAAIFQLPENGNVVGQLQHTVAQPGDTLVDIARQYNVGYNDIVAANPQIDPWLIKSKTHVIIPTQYILPDIPWQGVIVNIAEMRLYYFPPRAKNQRGMVFTFPVSIGRENWPTPQGNFSVVEKLNDPVWSVPKSVIKEHRDAGDPIPAIVPPGPDNPLGQYAILLDQPGYLIHGTNKPYSIGRRVSHGCLRLYPEDIEQLIGRIARGTSVKIRNDPILLGKMNNVYYVKVQNFVTPKKAIGTKTINKTLSKIAKVYGDLNQKQLGIMRPMLALNDGIARPIHLFESPSQRDQILFLHLTSRRMSNNNDQIIEYLQKMAFDVKNYGCDRMKDCLQVGPISSYNLRNAVADFIKNGFGIESYNLSAQSTTRQ